MEMEESRFYEQEMDHNSIIGQRKQRNRGLNRGTEWNTNPLIH